MKHYNNIENKVYSILPRNYNGVSNFSKASKETLEKNGFYELIEPKFNENTEKLGNVVKSGDYYTYEVVPLSADELQEKQIQQIQQMNDKFKADGVQYYNDIKAEVTMSLIGKSNATAMMTEIAKTIYPMLNKIKEGEWALAMIDYMDNQNQPTIQEVIVLFNKVGNDAISYYMNQYPH